MTCKSCGNPLPAGSSVCKYCGTPVPHSTNHSKRYSRRGRARKRIMNFLVLLIGLLIIAGIVLAVVLIAKRAKTAPAPQENTTPQQDVAQDAQTPADPAQDAQEPQDAQPEQPDSAEPAQPTEDSAVQPEQPDEPAAEPAQQPAEEPEAPVSQQPAVQVPEGSFVINRPETTASQNHYRELVASFSEQLPEGVSLDALTWSSSDPSIVRPEEADGLCRAWGVSLGQATVTATATLSNGQTFTVSSLVTVAEYHAPATDGYILSESDSRYYSTEELQSLSTDQLLKARNEIYARHGWIFQSSYLSSYFKTQSWYQPRVTAAEFDYSVLNSYERQNVATLLALEQSRG